MKIGLSQGEAARQVEVHVSSLSHYERGQRRDFSVEAEQRLAELYGTTVATMRREAGFRVKTRQVQVLVPADAEKEIA